MDHEQLRQKILKPQLRTVDLIEPVTREFGLVNHEDMPYKILSWDGNIAHCQELTTQEFAVCSKLALAGITLTGKQVAQIWESERPLELAEAVIQASYATNIRPEAILEAMLQVIKAYPKEQS